MAYIPPTITTYHAQFERGGAPIVMRGVNATVNLTGDPYSSWTVKLGAKYVRLRINWPDYEPARGQYDATMFGKLDSALKTAKSYGAQVLLDFHPNSIPTWVADRDDHFGRWSNAGFRADYLGIMRQVILRTQKYPNVFGYELWNEPNTGGNAAKDTTQLIKFNGWAINQLRPLDAKRAFVVMTRGGWDYGLQNANLAPLDKAHVVLDLHDQWCGCFNHAYTLDGEGPLHLHSDSVNQTVQPYQGTLARQEMFLQYVIANWRRKLHRPVIVGEFETVENDPNGTIYQRQIIGTLAKYKVSGFRWVGISPWQVVGTPMETQIHNWLYKAR